LALFPDKGSVLTERPTVLTRQVLPQLPTNFGIRALTICLLVGTVIFWVSLGTIGLIGKIIHDGMAEAIPGTMRSIAALTLSQCLRLIGFSAGLNLIACFPVYFARAPHSLAWLLFYAVIGAAMLTVSLALEYWYWFGHLAAPPPQLWAVAVLIGFASAVTGRAIVARLEKLEGKS